MSERQERMIDRWFPVAAVDEACGTTAGSGRVEKAIFTWFASRPIAQARGAAITSLLHDDAGSRILIDRVIRLDDDEARNALADTVIDAYDGAEPVVLDMFSGRGIIPLEASRFGAKAIGTDLSPVATLAGKLIAEFPARDWSDEPTIPFGGNSITLVPDGAARLVSDVKAVLEAVGSRVAARMSEYYPKNKEGEFPWGYLWTTTMPCDECKRRFPLLGSYALRHPYNKTNEPGQTLRLVTSSDVWKLEVASGTPTQTPTYTSATGEDGKKKKGKAARCPFCGHIHNLDTVKRKGFAKEFRDELACVADFSQSGDLFFRVPTEQERTAAAGVPLAVEYGLPYSFVPDEVIPSGNVHTVMGSGYGYSHFGDLMCARQARSFAETCQVIREIFTELMAHGVSRDYASALAAYAAATLCKRLRRSTRGAFLHLHGKPDGTERAYDQTADTYSNESKINFQFDFFEAGPGKGPGTWGSVSKSMITGVEKVTRTKPRGHCTFGVASATALPFRDSSVDVVITDPPYYDMIEYADASDIFYVWLKRALFDILPDLFGPSAQQSDGLQNKNDEIIVRRVHEPGRVRHDTDFYEQMLASSFEEAKRVLKHTGHLVVIFGHSDPDAWRRLLGALQTAGFVVTSAWPSRTENANTGVASIKVTITIGCRLAERNRPIGMGSEVDREVVKAVTERVPQWDSDGLALEDQLMASYGPAMEVYGKYGRVLNPDGSIADLDHYLSLARRTVRDAMHLRIDELPIETFDSITRFAIFWLRAKGRSEVPKGEARFFAQADELRLDDLRGRVLVESKAGFKLELQDGKALSESASIFEVVRAMATAWEFGGMEAVAATMAAAGVDPSSQHLWAVVGELGARLPTSDKIAKALAGIKRSSSTIATLAADERATFKQSALFDKLGV